MRSVGRHAFHLRRWRTMRRGAVFVTALGIIVILSGLVLVFAQNMRTESLASANRLAYIQADAIEQAGERWVLAQIESYPADAATITQVPAEALQVGDGYFWILHPDPDTDQTYSFGITDEASKLNLNYASADSIACLPGMTSDVADSIAAWCAQEDTGPADGAQSDYYESLPEPYECKYAPYESIEEVLLIKDMDKTLLYGYDLNHDGVIDPWERNANGSATIFNSANSDSRGIFNYVTIYSSEPNTSVDGKPRVNVNNTDTSALRRLLQGSLSQSRVNTVISNVSAIVNRPRTRKAFANIAAFYQDSGLTANEFGPIADRITTTRRTVLNGMVNINTAPRQVLLCLPELSESDADALIQKRSGADTSTIAWLFDALPATTLRNIGGNITARSFQYSADIVAVSGDGRSFKRVRIVVDSRTPPAKIVYRRDLTSLGWPLPPDVRASLRRGQGVITGLSGTSFRSLTGR